MPGNLSDEENPIPDKIVMEFYDIEKALKIEDQEKIKKIEWDNYNCVASF